MNTSKKNYFPRVMTKIFTNKPFDTKTMSRVVLFKLTVNKICKEAKH